MLPCHPVGNRPLYGRATSRCTRRGADGSRQDDKQDGSVFKTTGTKTTLAGLPFETTGTKTTLSGLSFETTGASFETTGAKTILAGLAFETTGATIEPEVLTFNTKRAWSGHKPEPFAFEVRRTGARPALFARPLPDFDKLQAADPPVLRARSDE